jgi:pimeloyl-ACP methyl ester carboxylesterase
MPARRRLISAAAVAAAGSGLYAAERLAAARVRNRPDPDPDVLTPLTYPVSSVPSHDGGTISYVRVGSGGSGGSARPIVLIHGVTLSVRTWVYQLRDLPAAGFDTIAFDQRGHGGSMVGHAGHAVEHLGDDVESLLDALDLRNSVLVGHSMGGIAVQSFLARHPQTAAERVGGVVLLSTLPRVPFGSRATRLRTLVERMTRRSPDTTRLWAAPNLGLLAARVGFGVDPQPSHVELVRQMMLECAVETRRDSPRALIGFDLVGALSGFAVPTLVIGGMADVITPPRDARLLADSIPGARLELLDGGGHMLMLERREAISRLITDFAGELPSGMRAVSGTSS